MQDRAQTDGLRFRKMHGLGNDFVIVDARRGGNPVDAALARRIGDRHFGIGFDQLAVILPAADTDADARLQFWNRDGSLSDTCGNATRCVAALLMEEAGTAALRLETGRGVLACAAAGGGLYRVNMGPPQLRWRDIPLAREVETLHLPIEGGPAALGMGNPHCVFFTESAAEIEGDAIARLGPEIEHHPLFPERTNVELVQPREDGTLRLRIWERGTGITLASGSCACAALVAAARRGLSGRRAAVRVDGGVLNIDWRADGVWLEGPVAHVCEGVLSPALLEGEGGR